MQVYFTGKEKFRLVSEYKPSGDQPEAIKQLVDGVLRGEKYQVLLGVTGSGKTFTIANVIAAVNKPVLVISHNKTLAAQLYGEFKAFFPHNAVEYFISYYDYYQPEAYIPSLDKYIEKDSLINREIEKYRLSATTALLSGRRDVIIVASVSCIYGIGNPKDFYENIFELYVGQQLTIDKLLRKLVNILYTRDEKEFSYGKFRVRGDSVDIYVPFGDVAFKIVFWGDEIDEILAFDPESGQITDKYDRIKIYPANIFMTSKARMKTAIEQIKLDLAAQVEYFKTQGKYLEAQRLLDRVTEDIELLEETGYCPGIENYSRYFDGRPPGTRPYCLLDYFPEDFLIILDESHVTVPQLRGMYEGDHSRKKILVEYGFRLPAALDNRPLKFEEFEQLANQIIFMSATPGPYELKKTHGVVVEQVVRPTGLLDPEIEVRPTHNQIDDLINEIFKVVERDERVLVTTLTKRMAEDLSRYLNDLGIKTSYIHSDIDAIERVKIMEELRSGEINVLVGVNLLREGLDLPEVSLVAILDADKEGFLRSHTALTQTAGRAARNINGKVIMYADKITKAMQTTIDETNRRRQKQMAYNKKYGITPKQVVKGKGKILSGLRQEEADFSKPKIPKLRVAQKIAGYMTKPELEQLIEKTKKEMKEAAQKLDFKTAAALRDELYELLEFYKKIYGEDYGLNL